MFICTVYISRYMYKYIYVYMFYMFYMFICLCVYMFICLYVYICIYIYPHCIHYSLHPSLYIYIWVNYNDLTATSL